MATPAVERFMGLMLMLIYDIFSRGLFLSTSTLLNNGNFLVLHLFSEAVLLSLSSFLILASPTLQFHRDARYAVQFETFSAALLPLVLHGIPPHLSLPSSALGSLHPMADLLVSAYKLHNSSPYPSWSLASPYVYVLPSDRMGNEEHPTILAHFVDGRLLVAMVRGP